MAYQKAYFKTERLMKENLRERFLDFFDADIEFEEFNAPGGWVDLVYLKFNYQELDDIERPVRRIPRWRSSEFMKLKKELDFPATCEEIREVLPASYGSTFLRRLYEWGFLEVVSHDMSDRKMLLQEMEMDWKYGIPVHIDVESTVAVELKIKDWKTALKQARRRQIFCPKVYVVMDENKVKPARDNIDKFKEHEVGLIGAGEEVVCYYHPEPNTGRRSKYINDKYKWQLNERSWEKYMEQKTSVDVQDAVFSADEGLILENP